MERGLWREGSRGRALRNQTIVAPQAMRASHTKPEAGVAMVRSKKEMVADLDGDAGEVRDAVEACKTRKSSDLRC